VKEPHLKKQLQLTKSHTEMTLRPVSMCRTEDTELFQQRYATTIKRGLQTGHHNGNTENKGQF
jgi:hypothetical protein